MDGLALGQFGVRGRAGVGLCGVAWRVSASLCVCGVLVGVLVGSAWGARGHVPVGVFGGPCGGPPCAGSLFDGPAGVAVDAASGVVYVVDKGDGRVEWFSAAGVFLGQWDGSETLEVQGNVLTGQPHPPAVFSSPEGIAIDNTCRLHELSSGMALSGSECEALDPSNGDVYVADVGHGVVDKFTATGGDLVS